MPPTKTFQGLDGFIVDFHQNFIEEMILISLKYSVRQKRKEDS